MKKRSVQTSKVPIETGSNAIAAYKVICYIIKIADFLIIWLYSERPQ